MTCLIIVALAALEPSGVADVVVTAVPPVNAERLADALRSYLTEYGIRVETARASADEDLRDQLANARRTGEGARALAVVRAEHGAAGHIEIAIVDLVTHKALVASLPRSFRDEDLYRTLALKIQALLRSTLGEAPDLLPSGSAAARFMASTSDGAAADVAARASVETGYTALAFPLGGPALQGLSVSAILAPRPWFDLTLSGAGLGGGHTAAGDVQAVASIIPMTVAARVRRRWRWFEALFGPEVEVALVRIAASSTTTPVRSTRKIISAMGAEVEGRAHVAGTLWLYARVAALGVLSGQRYTVRGTTIFDTSRFQLAAATGLGIDWR